MGFRFSTPGSRRTPLCHDVIRSGSYNKPSMSPSNATQCVSASLGEAIVGSNLACTPLPDLWRTTLLHEHLDGASRLSLSNTCKSARDWVWQTAQSATLIADLRQPPRILVSWAHAARDRLRVRNLPTGLAFRYDQEGAPGTLLLLGLLHGHCSSIQEVQVYGHSARVRGKLLAEAIAATCPRLTCLYLHPCPPDLPPPAQLPLLTDLTVTGLDDTPQPGHTLRAIAPYITQLTALRFGAFCNQHLRLPALFRRSKSTFTSHTLRWLSIGIGLTNNDLSTLLQHAPVLKQLIVGSVALLSDDHVTKVWQVEQLTVTESKDLGTSLQWLPDSGASTFTLEMQMESPYLTAAVQGLPPTVLHRLQHWHLEGCDHIELRPGAQVANEVRAQPTALKAVLNQLAHLPPKQPPSHTSQPQPATYQPPTSQRQPRFCITHGWVWRQQLAAALSKCLSNHPQLEVDITVAELDDATLDSLIVVQRGVGQLRAEGWRLKRDHSHQTCAWTRLACDGHMPDLEVMVGLPMPAEGTLQLVWDEHGSGTLVVTAKDIKDPEGWAQRLGRLLFPRPLKVLLHSPGYTYGGGYIGYYEKDVDTQPALLRHCCTLLHGLHPSTRVTYVDLMSWSLTPAVVEALAGLPHWACGLNLNLSKWQPGPAVYCALAKCVPDSYTVWWVGGVTEEQLVDMLLGLSALRGARGRLAVDPESSQLSLVAQPFLKELGLEQWVTVPDPGAGGWGPHRVSHRGQLVYATRRSAAFTTGSGDDSSDE